MPDFTRPEYASYIQFCREHPQKREFRDGDWFWWPDDGVVYCYHEVAADEGVIPNGPQLAEAVWLPQLADWLDRLEAAGWPWTATGHLYRQGGRWGHCVVRAARSMDEWTEDSPSGSARTHEEAAARLCKAVTGSPHG